MDTADNSKMFLWCGKLTAQSNKAEYKADADDSCIEQLVLKRACLGPSAKEGERNVVEIETLSRDNQKLKTCLCSLRGGVHDGVSLSDVTLVSNATFKLVEGRGPVHLVGNHMILEDEPFDDSDDEDIGSDEELDSELMETDLINLEKSKISPQITELDSDDDEDEDEDDADFEKEEPKKAPILAKKRKFSNDENQATKAKPLLKKSKLREQTSPKTPLQQKQNKPVQISAKKKKAK